MPRRHPAHDAELDGVLGGRLGDVRGPHGEPVHGRGGKRREVELGHDLTGQDAPVCFLQRKFDGREHPDAVQDPLPDLFHVAKLVVVAVVVDWGRGGPGRRRRGRGRGRGGRSRPGLLAVGRARRGGRLGRLGRPGWSGLDRPRIGSEPVIGHGYNSFLRWTRSTG